MYGKYDVMIPIQTERREACDYSKIALMTLFRAYMMTYLPATGVPVT